MILELEKMNPEIQISDLIRELPHFEKTSKIIDSKLPLKEFIDRIYTDPDYKSSPGGFRAIIVKYDNNNYGYITMNSMFNYYHSQDFSPNLNITIGEISSPLKVYNQNYSLRKALEEKQASNSELFGVSDESGVVYMASGCHWDYFSEGEWGAQTQVQDHWCG